MPVARYALTGTPTPIRPKEEDECRGLKSSPERCTSCKKVQCLFVTLWFDKREIAVLSSNCNPDERITVQRRAKAAPHVKDVDIPTRSTFTTTAWVVWI